MESYNSSSSTSPSCLNYNSLHSMENLAQGFDFGHQDFAVTSSTNNTFSTLTATVPEVIFFCKLVKNFQFSTVLLVIKKINTVFKNYLKSHILQHFSCNFNHFWRENLNYWNETFFGDFQTLWFFSEHNWINWRPISFNDSSRIEPNSSRFTQRRSCSNQTKTTNIEKSMLCPKLSL